MGQPCVRHYRSIRTPLGRQDGSRIPSVKVLKVLKAGGRCADKTFVIELGEILGLLTTAGPLHPRDIVRRLNRFTPDDLRGALRVLLYHGVIRLDESGTLRVVAPSLVAPEPVRAGARAS